MIIKTDYSYEQAEKKANEILPYFSLGGVAREVVDISGNIFIPFYAVEIMYGGKDTDTDDQDWEVINEYDDKFYIEGNLCRSALKALERVREYIVEAYDEYDEEEDYGIIAIRLWCSTHDNCEVVYNWYKYKNEEVN